MFKVSHLVNLGHFTQTSWPEQLFSTEFVKCLTVFSRADELKADKETRRKEVWCTYISSTSQLCILCLRY